MNELLLLLTRLNRISEHTWVSLNGTKFQSAEFIRLSRELSENDVKIRILSMVIEILLERNKSSRIFS